MISIPEVSHIYLLKYRALKNLINNIFKSAREIVKRMIKSCVESNYYTARFFYIRKLQWSTKQYGKSPLLIYQMGKVGSSTIKQTLALSKMDMPIFHVHYLSEYRVEELEKQRRKYFRTDKYSSLKRPWLYKYLRKELIDKFDGQKCKIISLTRDPIARNLSSFFENLEFEQASKNDIYTIKSDYYKIDPITVTNHNLDRLTNFFFERLNHNSPLVFFDSEIKTVFGIDIYSSEFPKSKGYKIYSGEKADLLIIRLEDLNRCIHQALNEFLGINEINLVKTNIGGEKEYAAIYSKFKNYIILPESYINKMYQSKYMQHFYSQEEIRQFKIKWFRAEDQKQMKDAG